MNASNKLNVRGRAILSASVSLAAMTTLFTGAPAWAQQAPPAASNTAAPADDSGSDSDSIVVTGRRAALEQADQRKRRNETIVDSVVADDAGKLPDNSITEVLQRVSGVSIVRFAALNDPDHYSVQGSSVQVRGLTGVASRLNGREIFSANNGRAILWGDVTPELMSAVDVYKASTADLIEGGTGGQIDLRTKLPFDFSKGFHVAATGELSMGDLAQKADESGSLLITNRWSTPIGEIGVLADVAYSQFSSLSQFFRMEPYLRTRIDARDYYIPAGYTYGDEAFQRKRTGIYGAVQWAPSESFLLTGTFFQSRYKNQSSDYGAFVTSQSLAVDPATSEFDEVGGLLKSDSVFVRDSGTFLPSGSPVNSNGNKGFVRSNTATRDYSLAFQFTPQDSPLSIKGAIQRVESTSIVDRLDVFRTVAFPTGFGLDLTGKLPQVTVPAGVQATFTNPANYSWLASMPHNENNKGRLDSANLDLEYALGDDSFFRSIKVGGRYSDRSERDFNNSFNWAALGLGWNGDPALTFANAAPGDIEFHAFKNFFRGGAGLPGNLMFPSFDLVSRLDRVELHQSPPAGFCTPSCAAAGPLSTTGYGGGAGIRPVGFVLPNDRTDYSTKTWAGYALTRFGQADSGISGNVGVRVVHLKNESSGYYQQNSSQFIRNGQTLQLDPNTNGVRSGGASFTRVLPSINLDYTTSPSTKIRFAYNITMDNASFLALRAARNVGVFTTGNPAGGNAPNLFANFTSESGEPRLKPTMSNNFDLSFEYYGRAGTSFHLAPFYKRLTNLPVFSLIQRQVPIVFIDGTSETAVAATSDYANATKAATIKGVELGGRMFFDMLPGWLSGFGVEANYTFIDSKNPGDTYRDINGVVHSDAPVVGLSKHNANATLLYEKDPFSVRIAYSWRSKYLQTTNGNGTSPTYQFLTAPGVSQSVQIALPVYGDAYGSLDAGVRFKVTKNFSFGIQGTNLTNSTQRTLMGGYPGKKLYTRSWFQSDRRIAVGASLAF